ncbi:helix-turn-helix domain-containing protein, partial [Pseudonocardia sp.]|uniref:helix-turn-helix domain-containing protein n=1 Tax=Pseudonocardia sp. TaxID=60912 RepID=UPI0031FD28EA
MSRPPLPIGTWGRIHTRVEKTDDKGKSVSHRAKAKYRDHDGITRTVSAFGRTKTAAENNLVNKLKDRAKTSHVGDLTAMHRIQDAIELWEKKFAELVAEGQRSPSSLDTYRRAIKNRLLPALGELRIGEASTPRIDSAISEIRNRAGTPTARTCRSIISGVMSLAVRYGAITVNPVREVDRIEHNAKKLPRALTAEEVRLLRKQLSTDERAARADLSDLVTFMLGTGVRIGEALAVLWSQVDLETGQVKITHTIVRIRGEGLLRKITKSKAGQRELGLPNWALAVLRVSFAAGVRLDEPIFADAVGGFRDPSNVRRSLREALSPVGGKARRDLGLSLRAARRDAGMTRKQVAETLDWSQNKIALIETGRIKVDRPMVTILLWTYGPQPEATEALLAQFDQAAKPAPADALAWITSHAFRKTTATVLDDDGQTARQIADHLGHARV